MDCEQKIKRIMELLDVYEKEREYMYRKLKNGTITYMDFEIETRNYMLECLGRINGVCTSYDESKLSKIIEVP